MGGVGVGGGWGLGGTVGGRPGRMTMEGLRRVTLIALIIALALYLFVILSFGAYSIFLLAKWLIGHVWSGH
jgi:hypothetical protein